MNSHRAPEHRAPRKRRGEVPDFDEEIASKYQARIWLGNSVM
jgi:hypothetical protein